MLIICFLKVQFQTVVKFFKKFTGTLKLNILILLLNFIDLYTKIIENFYLDIDSIDWIKLKIF